MVYKNKYLIDTGGVQEFETKKTTQTNPITLENEEKTTTDMVYSTPFQQIGEDGIISRGLSVDMLGLRASQMKPNLYEKGSVLWHLLGGNDAE